MKKSGTENRKSEPWFRLFLVFVLVVLFLGWQVKDGKHFVPGSGLGYFAGVAGTFFMFTLLLYTARKRVRLMRGWGAAPDWFKAHMVLGVAGPALILLHCNFTLGSLNSSIALISTIVVAISGLTGRYVYNKVYFGYSDRQMSLKALQNELDENRSGLEPVFRYIPGLKDRLRKFEHRVKMPYELTIISALFHVLYISAVFWKVYFTERVRLKRFFWTLAEEQKWPVKKTRSNFRKARLLLKIHLNAVLRVTTFSFFERAFSLWHILHLPLFFFLVLIVSIHVIVVGMF